MRQIHIDGKLTMTEHLVLDGTTNTPFMHFHLIVPVLQHILFFMQPGLTETESRINYINLQRRGHSSLPFTRLIRNSQTRFPILLHMLIIQEDIGFLQTNIHPTTAGLIFSPFMHIQIHKFYIIFKTVLIGVHRLI